MFKTYAFCEYIGYKWMITATGKLILILLFTKLQGALIRGGAFITNCTVFVSVALIGLTYTF